MEAAQKSGITNLQAKVLARPLLKLVADAFEDPQIEREFQAWLREKGEVDERLLHSNSK